MARRNNETGAEPAGAGETDPADAGPAGCAGLEAGASTLDAVKGRTNEEGSDPAKDMRADTASGRGERESLCGGKHGDSRDETMMERILAPENLAAAWKRVKANKGAPGIDGMTVGAFPAFCRAHWPRIRQAIKEGTYRPAPVRRVFVPKPDGTQRPLGVPTVLDCLRQFGSGKAGCLASLGWVIQQAMAQVLGPLFEADFSAHSYGFREGRNAHQAVRQVEAGWKERRRHAVD